MVLGLKRQTRNQPLPERTGGLYGLLTHPRGYRILQRLADSDKLRQRLAENCVMSAQPMTVVDIGAGTGDLRPHIRCSRYIAVEPNPRYAQEMRSRFADDPSVDVIQGRAGDLAMHMKGLRADRVVLIGVLHHLSDDEVHDVLTASAQVLTQTGRIATVDPCFHDRQSWPSHFLVSRDRGRSVRHSSSYASIMLEHFPHVRIAVTDSQYRIPYSHAWIVAGSTRAALDND